MPAVLSRVGSPGPARGLTPDVRGLSARAALRTLAQLGLAVRLVGSGVVTAQVPAAGTPLERGGAATLHLARRPSGGADP
jgi:hypothetical protein